MTLKQLLLSGNMNDIRGFFKGNPLSVLAILIITTRRIQTFPEELRTKNNFISELCLLRDEKEFSEYPEINRDILKALAGDKNWDKYLSYAIQEVIKC